MQDINNCIKENDTDNVNIKMIDNIVLTLVGDEDNYEEYYGKSKTISESLEKVNRAISEELIDYISSAFEFNYADLQLNVNGDTKVINVSGQIKSCFTTAYNILSIGKMEFSVDNITNSNIVNGEIEIGTIKGSKYSEYANMKVDGILNGVCTINNIKQMCALRFEAPTSGDTKVYLVLNDTNVLTSTSSSLYVEVSGTLHHDYDGYTD